MKRTKKVVVVAVIVSVVVLSLVGVWINVDRIAVRLAPAKQAAASRTEAATRAEAMMRKALLNGDYDAIPRVLEALTGAYLENPTDATTAAHIGFMHMWRLVERARLDSVPTTITDHAVLARRYFQEAVALNPSDARYLGFLGSATLAEGSIHGDQKIIRRGYYTLLDAIEAWPEFNLFTAGYSMSRRPADSPQFRQALEWQWRNVDLCAKRIVDRRDPDFAAFGVASMTQADPRVCANSAKVPHNWEGFFLNLGDMLVKAGDWQTGRKAYANARLSADYTSWKFRDVLEDRIKHAEANVARFNEPDRRGEKRAATIMVNSSFACVGCHQAGAGKTDL